MEADGAAAAAATKGREAEIMEALRARVPFFKKQADSLTLEGVRRTLEKDMDLKINSLDPHKKFIRQCVDKVFSGCDNENTDNASERAEAKVDNLSEDAQPMSVSNKISSSPDEQGARSSKTNKDPEGVKNHSSGSDITEAMIKKAIDKRASYFRENSETLTLLGVRRTLEEDLKLERKALDAFKDFITKELDRVLQEPENGTTDHSKQEACKDAGQKTSKGSKRARQDFDTSELNNSHSEKEDSDEDVRPIKKKQQAAPAHGKRVERLKSVIKSCGMSVPPSVYRRAKQAPESKREACLIKELEDMLEKEGLSSHPSEKGPVRC
uniref:Histone chaperone domain-containing protein n=1 Tax=Triticum urartu TaxID=4572 RepID=A0A8R7U7D0_TRIUA